MINPSQNMVYLALEPLREGHAAHTHVSEIIKGLEKRGWSITLYNPSYANKKTSPHLLVRFLHCMSLQIKMWAGWKKGSILYCRAHYLAFPSALIAKSFNIPIVHEVNGPYDDVFIAYPSLLKFKNILIWMQKKQYVWADRVIAVTQQLCKIILADVEHQNVYFIRNGANVDMFRPGLLKPENAPHKYAIFFGSMSKWHRLDNILDALKQPEWPSDTDIIFIGDGADKTLVDAAAAQNPRIHLLGRMKPNQMAPYISNAICGLVTTANVEQADDSTQRNTGNRSETGLFPLKLFETLASGIPAVVTDYPGQADLIRDHKCGIVVAPNSPKEIAAAVNEISSNSEQQKEHGERASIIVREKFSWDNSAHETDLILKSLII
jgi:glycosyltransferase involved in cell wall biosynthesis